MRVFCVFGSLPSSICFSRMFYRSSHADTDQRKEINKERETVFMVNPMTIYNSGNILILRIIFRDLHRIPHFKHFAKSPEEQKIILPMT